MHHLRSQILGNERRVWVYTPPDYTRDGKPYDLFLLCSPPKEASYDWMSGIYLDTYMLCGVY